MKTLALLFVASFTVLAGCATGGGGQSMASPAGVSCPQGTQMVNGVCVQQGK